MATTKKVAKAKEDTKKTSSATRKSSATKTKKLSRKPKKVSSKKNPTNMEELLVSSGYEISVPQKGQTITGLITTITRKVLLMDIGAKTEGIVTDREFDAAREYIETLSLGDEISVYVVTEENDKGLILLSLKKAMFDTLWDMLDGYVKKNEALQVIGMETNRGGMIVKWQGLRGFVPSSQFGASWAGDIDQLLGKTFKVKVIEIDREKNRLIFSEKHVSESELLERREQALDSVKVGEKYPGTVTGLMSFGAFVAVEVPVGKGKEKGAVEGLVHISEISWEKVDKIESYVKVGDELKVKVLGIEEGTGKLNLSIKQLANDPWDDVEKKYGEGKKVSGTVSRVVPFGVFVHFEPGVDGLIHVSKLPADRELKEGEKVDVYVENLDAKQRRMSLNMVLSEVPVGYK